MINQIPKKFLYIWTNNINRDYFWNGYCFSFRFPDVKWEFCIKTIRIDSYFLVNVTRHKCATRLLIHALISNTLMASVCAQTTPYTRFNDLLLICIKREQRMHNCVWFMHSSLLAFARLFGGRCSFDLWIFTFLGAFLLFGLIFVLFRFGFIII